jgi:predicted PurR-regulated permease PerM
MRPRDHVAAEPEPLDSPAEALGLPRENKSEGEVPPAAVVGAASTVLAVQAALLALALIAFLFFARSVVLPVFLACVAGMALKPLIRWLSYCHIPPPLSAAVVLSLLVISTGLGFVQLGRPAVAWIDEAPQHLTELRQRIRMMVPALARYSQAATAVDNLGATEQEQAQVQSVELKASRFPGIVNWTGSLLVGLGETLVLLYLVLASGDLFLQKLVRVMPTLGDKKRAVEISHEVQQQISNYLFSVSVINLGLGVLVSGILFWLGVPNAALWGVVVAALNFIPYFGPVAGIALLATVGILTFDTLWKGLLPAGCYLVLHLLEANLITPMVLGRRFTLNPVVIFVFLILWTWLWGVPGALLSVPMLVTIKVLCDNIPAFSSVSELLSN